MRSWPTSGRSNAELTVLEDRFSSVLGEGARWIRDLLFVVASAAVRPADGDRRDGVHLVRAPDSAESEGRYRMLLDAAPDAIVVTDQDGRVVLFNEAAERSRRRSGRGRDRAIGVDRHRPRNVATTRPRRPNTARRGAAGRATTGRAARPRADGGGFWAESTIADLGLGQERGPRSSSADVSEPPRGGERAPARARSGWPFALSAGRMGTWDWDMKTGVIRWSESLEGDRRDPAGLVCGGPTRRSSSWSTRTIATRSGRPSSVRRPPMTSTSPSAGGPARRADGPDRHPGPGLVRDAFGSRSGWPAWPWM
jgi:PAS domain S-box-containing protein